jgi:hypothetical protein
MASQVILFENADFEGNHKHVFSAIENLRVLIDPFNFNDKTSSLVVIEGEWQFFKDFEYENPFPATLGPGVYSSVTAALVLQRLLVPVPTTRSRACGPSIRQRETLIL